MIKMLKDTKSNTIQITIISDEECDAQSSDSVTAADPDTGECSTEASRNLDGDVADFPAVFFHICHGTQQAVVTPYRAYQNV